MLSNFFLDQIEIGNVSRQNDQQTKIIKFLSKFQEAATIPEITKHLKTSIPTTTKLINNLIKAEWIVEHGKKENEKGRNPILYTINNNRFYAVGVEILLKRIQITIIRINSEVVLKKNDIAFILENNEACLGKVVRFIKKAIVDSNITTKQIVGIGIGITGRVNSDTGESLNYFNFMERPLRQFFEEELKTLIVLDNDTRVLGITEQVMGTAKDSKNALVVNISRGLGLTIISNGKIVQGTNGYAGEFGHMQFGNSDRLCMCGKQRCIGVEVSGYALEEDLKEALLNGKTSIYLKKEQRNLYQYDDIIDTALKGDGLALKLIQKQGLKLGEALGNILNLLNPELIVIGGEFARLKNILKDSVKMGIKNTALIDLLMLCEISVSNLGNEVGSKGAALMIWKKYELI